MAIDIVDILLARAKSFTGETKTLVQQAQAAMSDANDIVDRLSEIQQETQEANESAQDAADRAQEIAGDLEQMHNDVTAAAQELIDDSITASLVDVNSDITELQNSITNINNTIVPELQAQIAAAAQSGGDKVTISDNNSNAAKIRNAVINDSNSYVVEKNYTSTGLNEDGSMTQKAITNALTATKNEIEAAIDAKLANITISGGGTVNLGIDNEGHLVVVGINGQPIAAAITETDVIESLIKSGSYHLENTVGLEMDYENKIFTSTQDNMSTEEINKLPMFGGRKRCNVADDGTITAFYGESNYREDGSNGQVMVYQPKFYYRRVITKSIQAANGQVSRKESLIISPIKLTSSFKIHPLFINELGEEVEYVLLSAYEGSIYNTSSSSYDLTSEAEINLETDKLSSIAGAKPVTGYTHPNFTMLNAEHLAVNRGAGWHITNLAFESAQQMLMSIEYSTLNGQVALKQGIVNLPSASNANNACITGSTSALGNSSGEAESSTGSIDGVQQTYTEEGKLAITYRGLENPWGNTWRYVGGSFAYGTGLNTGGKLYINTDFNYSLNVSAANIYHLNCTLPSGYNWVSSVFAFEDQDDWIYLPAEFSSANSALPIGDVLWTTPYLNGTNSLLAGGDWDSKLEAGLYSYACDRKADTVSSSINARLMYIPIKNASYTANIAKWQTLGV